jgi:hypothetical protein
LVLNCKIAIVRDRKKIERRKIKAPPLFALALEGDEESSSRSDRFISDNELQVSTGDKLYAFTRDTRVNLVVMIIILWFHSGRLHALKKWLSGPESKTVRGSADEITVRVCLFVVYLMVL